MNTQRAMYRHGLHPAGNVCAGLAHLVYLHGRVSHWASYNNEKPVPGACQMKQRQPFRLTTTHLASTHNLLTMQSASPQNNTCRIAHGGIQTQATFNQGMVNEIEQFVKADRSFKSKRKTKL